MAEKKEAAINTGQPKEVPALFPVGVLKKNSVKLFKVSSAAFAGAFTHAVQGRDYTIKEADNIIKSWLVKGAK